jgi:hypothetical protein
MLGVLTCPGIIPTVFTILWKRQSRIAAVSSPLLGLATGIGVWLGSASALYGEISVATTGETLPCVYGTVASALSPGVYSIVLTLIKPDNFDWADFRKERLAFDTPTSGVAEVSDSDKNEPKTHEEHVQSYAADKAKLKRWGTIAAIWAISTFLGHWVLW